MKRSVKFWLLKTAPHPQPNAARFFEHAIVSHAGPTERLEPRLLNDPNERTYYEAYWDSSNDAAESAWKVLVDEGEVVTDDG